MTMLWPETVLAPRAIDPDLDVRTLSGGPSLSGDEMIAATTAGRWRISYGGVPVMTLQQQKCWNAIAVLMEGRANSIAVPVANYFTAPWPLQASGARKPRSLGLHSDGTPFSDESVYWQDLIVATIRAASAGASSVVIDLVDGQALEPGHVFGVGEDRAYKIKTVSAVGSVYTCTIAPTLRAAITADTPARFDVPRVKCRLASDDSMRLVRDLGRFGSADIEFIEVW